LQNDDFGKILSLWLNSTFGAIMLFSIAETTRGPWIKFKKNHLWNLPVLDLFRLVKKQIRNLLKTYELVVNREFDPFPQEFKNLRAHKLIDDTEAEIFISHSFEITKVVPCLLKVFWRKEKM